MERYPDSEKQRLSPCLVLVLEAMRDGKWTTLEAVAKRVGMRNASTCGSRLRDFASSEDNKSPKHEWRYARRGTDIRGCFEYRLYFVPMNNPLQLELEAVNA